MEPVLKELNQNVGPSTANLQLNNSSGKEFAAEMGRLAKQINDLMAAQRSNKPRWRRELKDEDPRSVHYAKMLKRLGLSEKHARFAPWFHKSDKIKLSRWSTILFEQLFLDYKKSLAGQTEGERALEAYQTFMTRIHSKDLEPYERNQAMIMAAYRDCSFKPPPVDLERSKRIRETHPAFRPSDPVTEHIKLVTYKPVAPGLAPPVSGQLESHGKHVYYTYIGRWKDGHMRGPKGLYQYADGGQFLGTWKDSTQCGPGVAEYPNKAKYTGSWKAGKYHGYGVLEYANKTKYEGHWIDGKRHGKGKLVFPSSASYEGDFFMGYREGIGTALSAKGYKYSGEWRHNRIRGHGVLTLLNGKKIVREDWEPMMLGEAVLEAKEQYAEEELEKMEEMRDLLRVRDDLRARELQKKYQDRVAAEKAEALRLHKLEMKRLRREKKEKEEAAKQEYLKNLTGANASDSSDYSDSDDDSEGDSFSDDDDDDDDSEDSDD